MRHYRISILVCILMLLFTFAPSVGAAVSHPLLGTLGHIALAGNLPYPVGMPATICDLSTAHRWTVYPTAAGTFGIDHAPPRLGWFLVTVPGYYPGLARVEMRTIVPMVYIVGPGTVPVPTGRTVPYLAFGPLHPDNTRHYLNPPWRTLHVARIVVQSH